MGAVLSNCKTIESSIACPNMGPGLSTEGFKGSNLPIKSIAFIFSGGPGGKTGEIVDYLYSNQIQAAFFATGHLIEENKEHLSEARRKSHLVGISNFSGQLLSKKSDIVLDVRQADRLVTPYVSANKFLYSPILGQYERSDMDKLNKAGLRKYTGPILWDIGYGTQGFLSDKECWEVRYTVGTCADNYIKQIKALEKGIVAFHTTTGETLELVKTMVPTLVATGFQFVRLDQIPDIRAQIQANGGLMSSPDSTPSCEDY